VEFANYDLFLQVCKYNHIIVLGSIIIQNNNCFTLLVKNIDHVLSPLIWKISHIIIYIFFMVVNAYVLYQPHGH
jgi:hypothetical protein